MSFSYEEIDWYKDSHITSLKYIKTLIRVSSYLAGISYLLRNTTPYLSHVYIYFIIAFFGIIIHHFITREKVWKIKLENNTYLIFNKNLPNEATVNEFIDKLFEQRKKYLKETYLVLNENMSYDRQFSSLQWLRKAGVIDGEEFENYRKELDRLFSGHNFETFLN